MRVPLRPLVLLLLAWLTAGALSSPGSAGADEPGPRLLLLSVERTAGTHERPRLGLRCLQPGPVELRLSRVAAPGLLAAGDDDLRRPEGVAAALQGYEFRARTEAAFRSAPLFEAPRALRVAYAPPAGAPAGAPQTVDLDPLPAGLYRVEAQAGPDLKATALLLVSDLALVTKRDALGLTAWAVARRDGAPQPGVVVQVRERGARRAEGRTDADGLLRLAGDFARTVRVVAERGADLALGDEGWVPADAAARRVWMVTHQPAYRPGERVEVKGVLRAVDGSGRPVLDAGVSAATVRLVGAGERVLAEAAVPVGAERGTFAASLLLPADAPTGPGEVQAEVDGRLYAAPLLVDAYRRPPFAVTVAPAAPRALVGSAVSFRVAARGYDGAALPGARLTWELVFHRVDRDLFPEDEFVRLFFGTERDAFAPVPLAHGEGALGADGTQTVESTLPALTAGGFVTLRATVAGPDGLHVSGSGVLGVDTSPITVALASDRHVYGPEDAAHVTVRVATAAGGPAAGRPLRLMLAEVREPAAAGPAGAAPAPEALAPVSQVELRTDERGQAQADVSLPRSAAYLLSVEVPRQADEPAGPPAVAERRVWAVGEHATLGYAGERLEVLADRDAYRVGDVARVLVLAPPARRAGAGRALLASVEGARLLGARVLRTTGTSAVLEVPLTEDHVPNVWVSFAAVDEGGLLSGSVLLRLPPVTRLLSTTIAPDAERLAPGAVSGATLRVTDAQGQPVAGAEVSLAVVDEALHALFPDPSALPAAFFHPLRRNGVASGGPLHLASVGFAWRAPSPALRAEAPAGRPDPGELGAPSPGAPVPSPAPAAAPAAPAGGEAAPQEMERRLEDADFRGLGAAKKDKAEDGPLAPGTTRADFRTAVFWAPTLVTGPDGTARAEGIRYADTLTRWRLTAHSVDAATRVGSATAEVRTQKDLAVEVTLPRFLRVDDRVVAPLLLSNLTAEPLTGAAGARWGPAAPPDAGELGADRPLAPGSVVRAGALEVRPTAPGTLHVRAEGEAGPYRDRVARTLPVLPQGIEVREAVYRESAPGAPGALSFEVPLPRDVERGTLRAHLRLERGSVAAVRAALPYLVDYPYGCTEQTLSRFEPLLVVAEAADALRLPREGPLARVPELVAAGLERLAALQHADGGFGWWPADATNVEMTARAVRGLTRALRGRDDARAAQVRARAVERLAALLAAAPDDAASEALGLLALAEAGAAPEDRLAAALARGEGGRTDPLVGALLVRAALAAGLPERARPAALALRRQARRDAQGAWFAPGRAPAGGEGPVRWQEDPVETTAVALLALAEAEVGAGEVLAEGARWLRAQRSGGEVWRSTRDTAAAVAFLVHQARQEALADAAAPFRVRSGERLLGTLTLDLARLVEGGAVLDVSAALDAAPSLALQVEGTGEVAGTLVLSGFATGPAIERREAGLRVERVWHRLTPQTREGRVVHVRAPLTETVEQGALLECEVRVTSGRALEYVQVTDPHAAGFEPARPVALVVEGAPGEPGTAPPGDPGAPEVQRYDDRTEFFLTRLPAGTTVLRHVVRVTHVGAFTALPAQARLMYFPAVSGSSQGEVLEVTPAQGPAEGGVR